MPEPQVSVVVTTCDYGRFLTDCLESLDRQTRPIDRLVVVDDASSDATPRILDSLLGRLRLGKCAAIIRHGERAGLASSLNEGIAATSSEFVAHVDADDTVEPNYVESLLHALTNDPSAGYSYPRLRLFGDENGLMATYPFDAARLAFEGNYIANVALMRRRAFDDSGGFRDLRTHLDWDLWLAFLDAGWPGVLVDEPLYNWRRHGRTMTLQPASERLRTRARIQWDHRSLLWQYRSTALLWTSRATARRIGIRQPAGSPTLTPSGWIEHSDAEI